MAAGQPYPWMMEYPVQVGECIGCDVCISECPVQVMTLDRVPGATPLLPRQGPVTLPSPPRAGWVPFSEVTLESLKPNHPEPFEPEYRWRFADRAKPWPTWSEPGTEVATPEAPCQTACPAGTDAGRYVGLIADGRYDDAYAVAAEVNPFPSVCGWICTAPCEAACRRGTLDEPISIRTLKRFAAERGHLPPVAAPAAKRAERVAIVGGGPAGMSAAYYLARLGYPVTVFEAMPVPGGMMAIGIPEYRLPRTVLREEIERIVGLGVELRLDAAMGRDFTLGDLEEQGYRAIFLATGASKSRRLGVPGDDLPGVVPATKFLKEVNIGERPGPDRVGHRRRWRQHGHGCRAVGAALWSRVRDHRLPARSRRHAGSARGDRRRGARRHRGAGAGRAGRGPRRRSRRLASASRPRRPPASSRTSARRTRRSRALSATCPRRPSSWPSARSRIRRSCPKARGSR